MKRFVLALCIVFAFCSMASAINFTSMTFNLRGYNVWADGKAVAPTNDVTNQFDERTLVLTQSATGWTARAEFYAVSKHSSPDLYPKLSKWNFQTEEANFKLNLWGRGHSLSHYETPFTWVRDANASNATNWKARLTAQVFGGETVFSIDNAAATYYLFYKKVFGNTTLGTAYRTNFQHTTAASVYAISKLPGVTVTGEVSTDGTWDAVKEGTKLAPKYGLQGVFDFGLTLKGTYISGTNKLTVEATQLMTDQLSRYYASYDDTAGVKTIVGEVTFRAKNDQAITNAFGVTTNWWQYATANWTKTTGWAAGAKVTRKIDSNIIINLNGFYEFVPGTAKALATINYTNNDNPATADTWNVNLRGFYKVDAKTTILPQVIIDKTWVKVGSYVDYVINKGRILGAAWYEYNQTDNTKSQEKFELGYQLAL